MGEMLVVRWPEHSLELRRTFTAMRDLGELLDVTLVTPDGEVEAHRIVLAASSELLRALLRKTATTFGPCSLVLRDLNITQLELVLDFIYRGELAVDKTQFELLARACDYLQIKALLNPEEGITVADQRVFDEEEPEVVPYHAVPAEQTGHADAAVTASKRRMSHRSTQETQHIEHMDPLSVPEEFQVIELVEESRPGSSGATPGTRRNRQEYAKRAKLTTVGDKKIFSLDEQLPSRGVDEKPVKRFCRECSLMFNYLSDYKEHRRQVHSLQCNHCNFRATKSSAVRDHFEKVHQNVRRFSCSECEFQCKDRATLYNHIRRHTNEKPYGCAYCNYKAAQSASMKQHVALHENIDSRPHRCDECTRYPISFASRSALTKHKKAHHSSERTQKQPLVMNLEIIKDEGGRDGDAIMTKVDGRPIRTSGQTDLEEEGTGSLSMSRPTTKVTQATLLGVGQSGQRRNRELEGRQIRDEKQDRSPEEEVGTEEVSDEVVAPPMNQDDDEDEEIEDEDADDEEEEIADAEEDEAPVRRAVSSSTDVEGQSVKINHSSIGGQAVTATATIIGLRQQSSQHHSGDHQTSQTMAVTPVVAITAASAISSSIEQHSISLQPIQQHQQLQPQQHIHLSGGHSNQPVDIHQQAPSLSSSNSSVVTHRTSVLSTETFIDAGTSTDSGLTVPVNVVGNPMMANSSHIAASGVNRQVDLDVSKQHSIVTPTTIVDGRMPTPSETSIAVHSEGAIVSDTPTTTSVMNSRRIAPMVAPEEHETEFHRQL